MNEKRFSVIHSREGAPSAARPVHAAVKTSLIPGPADDIRHHENHASGDMKEPWIGEPGARLSKKIPSFANSSRPGGTFVTPRNCPAMRAGAGTPVSGTAFGVPGSGSGKAGAGKT